jgi:hypothetical protein
VSVARVAPLARGLDTPALALADQLRTAGN